MSETCQWMVERRRPKRYGPCGKKVVSLCEIDGQNIPSCQFHSTKYSAGKEGLDLYHRNMDAYKRRAAKAAPTAEPVSAPATPEPESAPATPEPVSAEPVSVSEEDNLGDDRFEEEGQLPLSSKEKALLQRVNKVPPMSEAEAPEEPGGAKKKQKPKKKPQFKKPSRLAKEQLPVLDPPPAEEEEEVEEDEPEVEEESAEESLDEYDAHESLDRYIKTTGFFVCLKGYEDFVTKYLWDVKGVSTRLKDKEGAEQAIREVMDDLMPRGSVFDIDDPYKRLGALIVLSTIEQGQINSSKSALEEAQQKIAQLEQEKAKPQAKSNMQAVTPKADDKADHSVAGF